MPAVTAALNSTIRHELDRLPIRLGNRFDELVDGL
jgi:hypothetical protein